MAEYSVFYHEDGEIHSIVRGKHELSSLFKEQGVSVFYFTDVNRLSTRLDDGKLSRDKPKVLLTDSCNIPRDTKTIVFNRGEKTGIGDYVTILSVMQNTKSFFPEARIVFIGRSGMISIFDHHPHIETISHDSHEKPIGEDVFYVELENPCPAGVYESSVEHVKLSRNEIFCNFIGIPWSRERPVIYLREEDFEHHIAEDVMKIDREELKVGIALRSAEQWKDWCHTERFIKMMRDDGISVFVFDKDETVDIPGVKNVVGLEIRKAVAVASLMDIFVTPDTGWFHLCDAVGVKTVSIWGSMDASLHARKYSHKVKKTKSEDFMVLDSWSRFIQGRCVYNDPPCMYKVCCGKGNYQPCLNRIGPRSVLDLLK